MSLLTKPTARGTVGYVEYDIGGICRDRAFCSRARLPRASGARSRRGPPGGAPDPSREAPRRAGRDVPARGSRSTRLAGDVAPDDPRLVAVTLRGALRQRPLRGARGDRAAGAGPAAAGRAGAGAAPGAGLPGQRVRRPEQPSDRRVPGVAVLPVGAPADAGRADLARPLDVSDASSRAPERASRI